MLRGGPCVVRFQTIVIGLGAIGSATVDRLALRGHLTLGLERFNAAHTLGSSHGRSRMVRQAYYEDTAYVPLVARACELWRELEHDSGQQLLSIGGGLMLGAADSELVSGCLASARRHGLAYEMLDANDIKRRYPMLSPAPDDVALLEPGAGIVRCEPAVMAQLQRAAASGAELRFDEAVIDWSADSDGEGVTVKTIAGEYRAQTLVLAPGGWAHALLGEWRPRLEIERQVMIWLQPSKSPELFTFDRLPVLLWETRAGRVIYAIPPVDEGQEGVKGGFHHGGEISSPDLLQRQVTAADIEDFRRYLRRYLPALDGTLKEARVCMYTNTPDHNFIVAKHPFYPQVCVGLGFSGHGFKFATVIGEILADLATLGTTALPISVFDPARLSSSESFGSDQQQHRGS